jgi:putative DNA primase/helicase
MLNKNQKFQYVPFSLKDGKNQPVLSTFTDGIGKGAEAVENDYISEDFDIHLIVPDDLIVLDIDNHNVNNVSAFKALLESGLLPEIKTHTVATNTGLHLYFKNKIKGTTKTIPKSVHGPHVLKYFGFEVEVKNGKKNDLVKVIQKGVARPVINENVFAEIPVELTVFAKNGQNLIGLTENRNNELLKIPTEYRNFVNEHVFGEPLSSHEVQKMSEYNQQSARPENVEYLDDKGHIMEYYFSQYLVETMQVYNINHATVFKDLENNWRNIDAKEGWRSFTKTVTTLEPKTARLYSKLKDYGAMIEKESIVYKKTEIAVHLANCTLYNGRVYKTRLDNVPTPYVLPYEYNPNAYDKTVDDLLNRITSDPVDLSKSKTEFIPNASKRQLLIDIIAHCFLTQFERKNQTMFILTGKGNNGKSTFEKMIHVIFGDDLTSSVKLQTLTQKFQSFGLLGKLVNIGDDIADDYITNTDILKSVISGDPIQVEGKYGAILQNFRNQSTLLFSANEVPKARDRTHGWTRRVVIVPMHYNYKKDYNFVKDEKLNKKLESQSAIEYIIKLALERYEYVYANGPEIPQSVKDATETYAKSNDNVLAFIDMIKADYPETNGDEFWCYDADEEVGHKFDYIYAYYKGVCDTNGVKAFNITRFTDTVLANTNYELKNSDKRRVNIDPNTGKKTTSRVRFNYFIRKSS